MTSALIFCILLITYYIIYYLRFNMNISLHGVTKIGLSKPEELSGETYASHIFIWDEKGNKFEISLFSSDAKVLSTYEGVNNIGNPTAK